MDSRSAPPRYDQAMNTGQGNIYTLNGPPQPYNPSSAPYMPSNGPPYVQTTVHGSVPPVVVHIAPPPPGPLPQLSRRVVALHFVNSATYFFLGATVFTAFSIANIYAFYRNTVSVHIFMCVSGYVILMAPAVVSLSPFGGWANRLKTSDRKIVHAVMQVSGSTLAIIGCIIRISDSSYTPIGAHGIFGWIAMLLTIVTLIGGFINCNNCSKNSARLFKILHRYSGTLTLLAAFITMCLGFAKFNRYYFNDISGILGIIFTVCGLIGILISTFAKDFITS